MCQNVQIISELRPCSPTRSTYVLWPLSRGHKGVCSDDFLFNFFFFFCGRALLKACSFSTMAVLTQSSSRGYTFSVNKNTLKEDACIYREQLCNFPRLVGTHKRSHNEIRSKAQLEILRLTVMCEGTPLCHCGQSADGGSCSICR